MNAFESELARPGTRAPYPKLVERVACRACSPTRPEDKANPWRRREFGLELVTTDGRQQKFRQVV